MEDKHFPAKSTSFASLRRDELPKHEQDLSPQAAMTRAEFEKARSSVTASTTREPVPFNTVRPMK